MLQVLLVIKSALRKNPSGAHTGRVSRRPTRVRSGEQRCRRCRRSTSSLRTPPTVPAGGNAPRGREPREQIPSLFALDLRTQFLLSFHREEGKNPKKKRYFTQAERSTSELYFSLLRAGRLSRPCWRRALGACPCAAPAGTPGTAARAEGYCHFTGSPQKVFARPVYVLNIAEHTGHLQPRSECCTGGCGSAALTHTSPHHVTESNFFSDTLILGRATSETMHA